ncbi:Uncharacterised protein [Metamycoplasma arthritidis]|uniref:Uncharacterized protein n=1 Tax=Metamycoplasma arthritidis (strain 158L3-1) TaxID=243272 RepID=B3PMB3_META1|nr:hypothetical protein [Metamycoplasma arthritidis]ACF07165.1 hypothetical protein MARTH_orf261 [Metamycoplasma arthritidis 158L3-1]VEU78689.1 Uncharacterised protein [Metamycoplasma arthritidis]
MKKTIITTLKFQKSQIIFEAVEQASDLILPIYSNVFDGYHFSSSTELEVFVKNSKEALERIIKGKVSEIIIMVASDINENLKINNYSFSKTILNNNATLSELELEKEIIQEFEKNAKVIIKNETLNKSVKNNTLTLIKNVAFLEANFVSLVNRITTNNHLNVAKYYILDELKAFNDTIANKNQVFIDINDNYLKFDLFLGKNLLKTHIVNNGINQIRSKITSKHNKASSTLVNLAIKIQDDLEELKSQDNVVDTAKNVLDFYLEQMLIEYRNFLHQNSLNADHLKLNFYHNDYASAFKKLSIAKQVAVKICSNDCDFISQEMHGLINILTENIEKQDLKKFITTEIFVIDSILSEQKINRKNTLFI